MSDDLQATISANLGNTLQALDNVNKRLDAIVKTSVKATSASKDAQAQFSRTLKLGGEAAGKAGGLVGSIGGRILGGAGIEGNMGRVAAGLGLASLAFAAFNKVIEANTDRTQRLIEAQRKLQAVSDQADKATAGQAQSGAGQAGGMRFSIAMGGEVAERLIEILGKHGIGSKEAGQGLEAIMRQANLQGLKPNSPEVANAVATAAALTKVGIPFAEGAGTVAAGDISNPGVVQRRATKSFGRKAGLFGDAATSGYLHATENIDKSEFLTAATKVDSFQTQKEMVARNRTVWEGEADAQEDLAKYKNPYFAGLLDLGKEQNRVLMEIRNQGIAANETLIGRMDQLIKQMSGEDFATQYRRQVNANAQALATPGR